MTARLAMADRHELRNHARDGRIRTVIESVTPEIDSGAFPIKRVVGETVEVQADAFTDGHDAVRCVILHRPDTETRWNEMEMTSLGNDRFQGEFVVDRLGRYRYTVAAWVDGLQTWRQEFARRVEAADIMLAGRIGGELARETADRAQGADAEVLYGWASRLLQEHDPASLKKIALDEEAWAVAIRYPDRTFATEYAHELEVVVDPPLARFSAWYEFFPRSCSSVIGTHGTLRDCDARLDYVAQLGFDIVYLPPIHPIGQTNRKGANNRLAASANDPGSPWAIGATTGGHKVIHPELGTIEDFRRFVARARERDLKVALDIAFQAAPDHPYVETHPKWFRWRPDGTVQFAENPPKKYQDIYPFNFESDEWIDLWDELKSILDFWIAEGIEIFRVDNPHTKPFAFWQWAIGEVKRSHPEVIFLAEAFTRPKVMQRLAKLGFSQSYTYFAWRNTKREIVDYFSELTRAPCREYFRPNCWPNTPDILTEYLQYGGRPAFVVRMVLAATLSASYGIYGPAFELMDSEPREPGSEEYLDSEKYQLRNWDLERTGSLRHIIARLNRIRHEHPALQWDRTLQFHATDNDALLCYSKSDPQSHDKITGGDDHIVVVVNLDPHHAQTGWVELSLGSLTKDTTQPYQAHDLLSGARFLWRGTRNFVALDPVTTPAHIFRLRQRVRTERDFDYFL
jgi:starch synthase (maltosyl-transferring)